MPSIRLNDPQPIASDPMNALADHSTCGCLLARQSNPSPTAVISQFFMTLSGRHRGMEMGRSPDYAEGETSRASRGRTHLVLRAR